MPDQRVGVRNSAATAVLRRAMATNVRPAGASEPPRPHAWRRAGLVLAAALLVVASVLAQALDLTPVAILLLVLAVVTLAPLALPAVES